MSSLCLVFCLVAMATRTAIAFPQFLASSHCAVSMDIGTVMMGVEVRPSDKRRIVVLNDGVEVRPGDTVASLGDVDVYLEPRTQYAAFEVVASSSDAVRFDGGGCARGQRAVRQGTLQWTDEAMQDKREQTTHTSITIIATWGSGSAVYRTPDLAFAVAPKPATTTDL